MYTVYCILYTLFKITLVQGRGSVLVTGPVPGESSFDCILPWEQSFKASSSSLDSCNKMHNTKTLIVSRVSRYGIVES